MQKVKKISVILLALMLWLSAVVPISAATTVENGVEVTLNTDLQKYSKNQKITTAVTVKNTNDYAIENVNIYMIVPDGYQLADSNGPDNIAVLGAGETVTLTVYYTPESAASVSGAATSGAAATGDSSNVLLYSVLLIVALAAVVVLGVTYRKKWKGMVSMLLCLMMLTSMLPANTLKVSAAGESGTIRVSETVEVGDEKVKVESVVTYGLTGSDAAEEDEETDNSGEAVTPSEPDSGDEGGETTTPSEPDDGGDTEDGKTTRMEAILGLVNTALTYGRNLEGSYYPNLFIDGVNVETMEPVTWIMNGFTYYFSNFYRQQNLMKIFDGLTVLTGDDSYRDIAHEQYQFYFDNLTDENGLPYAGAHVIIDNKTGKLFYECHETKDYQLPWNLMWAADPEGTERFIEAFWNAHVYDMTSMRMDRHGYYDTDMGELWGSEYLDNDPRVILDNARTPFISSANDLMEAAYFLAEQTGDEAPALWADRMLDMYLGVQNKETGLIGSTYGTSVSDEYGLDRFIYNFKDTALEAYNETQYISRDIVKSTAGYGPQALLAAYNQTENPKIYQYITGNMLGVAKHVYNTESHNFNTPIMYDGVDVGGFESIRDGYYLNDGKTFAESESVFSGVLQSAIDVYAISGEKDIWEMARVWAENEGFGDIGTDLGENVNVNLNTTNASAAGALAAITLYKHTENMDYYNLACKIGDNIVARYYHDGLFYSEGSAYAAFDTELAYAVFAVEMMAQGKLDEIVDLKLAHGAIDQVYDGAGRINIGSFFYSTDIVPVETVTIDREEVTLNVDPTQNNIYPDTAGHWAESQIRQLASLGVLESKEDGNFYPDEALTRAEFVEWVVKLCGFNNTTKPVGMTYKDVSEDDWYYEYVVAAKNANILDINLGIYNFNGDQLITREEMASILIRALKAVNPNETYYIADALYRFTDADTISKWAHDYADIAVNYRIMEETSTNVFEPKLTVTRVQAVDALKNLSNYIANEDITVLTATVGPDDATDHVVTWTTSNPEVVEVDQNGKLYAIGVGEATITATAGGVSDTAKVTVSATENWMIKKVYIDGEKYDLFEPSNLKYTVELPLGTKAAPEIKAESYDGREVTIKYPESLPGTAEFYVDAERVYEIYFDPCKIVYVINESYNDMELGTKLQDNITSNYNWLITAQHKETVEVVERPDGDGTDKCIVIPYNEKEKYLEQSRLLFPGMEFKVGEAAEDDNLVIFDMDLMLENITAADEVHFSVRVADHEETANGSIKYNWIQRLTFWSYSDNNYAMEMFSDVGRYNRIGDFILDEFFNLKIVINKKELTADFYINNKLKANDQLPQTTPDAINMLNFHMAETL